MEGLVLNRSAGGRYYWKLVVLGPLAEASARAIEVDGWLDRHYGDRASQPAEELD
jgi:hypothetical protein